jgi:hypothetical protein
VNCQEALVVINEVERRFEESAEKLVPAIRKAVLLEHGIQVHSLLLVKAGTVPKTTSGKIKRVACRAAFLAGEMEPLAASTLPVDAMEPAFASEGLTRTDLLQAEPGLRSEFLESHLRNSRWSALVWIRWARLRSPIGYSEKWGFNLPSPACLMVFTSGNWPE